MTITAIAVEADIIRVITALQKVIPQAGIAQAIILIAPTIVGSLYITITIHTEAPIAHTHTPHTEAPIAHIWAGS